MRAKTPPTCKRRGCDVPRSSWQFACEGCWAAVPFPEKQRYLRAKRAKLTGIAAKISREILRDLGRKPASPSPSAQIYARTAAMLGERDHLEPAE